MSSTVQIETPSFRHSVFAKTAAGKSELVRRTLPLSRQQRGLLIVIDGKRDYDALGNILPEPVLEVGLCALRDLGLIATLSADVPKDAAGQVADKPGAERFSEVKKLMIHSAEGYLGPMAGALVRQIAAANDEKHVRSAMGHWHMAMRESKFGRAEISELIVRVKALLSDGAPTEAH